MPYFGIENGVVDKNGKTARLYLVEEKAAEIRMVRTLRAELGLKGGTAQQFALQLGHGLDRAVVGI